MNEKKTEVIIESGKQEITITRIFHYPRSLVFKAVTDPQAIPLWWGPRYLVTTVDKMEVKPGGRWRYLQKDPEGTVHAFHGVYHEIIESERIVGTFEYEGAPGKVVLDDMQLFEKDGVTTMISHSVFQSVADRDEMVRAGMEGGVQESTERLMELLLTYGKKD